MSEPQQPLLDRREAERINLAVLKKLDPQTEEVANCRLGSSFLLSYLKHI